jgi:hypothetical protein
METPSCLKCDLSDAMVPEDSGLTYTSWRCTRCNVSRTKKNLFGKALPFAGLALFLLGLPGGDGCSPDCGGGG